MKKITYYNLLQTKSNNQQVNSFNSFILFALRHIVKKKTSCFEVTKLIILKFTHPKIGSPTNPSTSKKLNYWECLNRQLNYSSGLRVEILIESCIGFKKSISNLLKLTTLIGWLPIMVGSCLCYSSGTEPYLLLNYGLSPIDPGGYFIIKGKEHYILIQEVIKPSIFNYKKHKNNISAVKFKMRFSNRNFYYKLIFSNNSFVFISDIFTQYIDVFLLLEILGLNSKKYFLYFLNNYISYFKLPTSNVLFKTKSSKQENTNLVKNIINPILKTKVMKNGQFSFGFFLKYILLSEIPAIGDDFSYKIVFLILLIKKFLLIQTCIKNNLHVDIINTTRYYRIGDLLKLSFTYLFNRFYTHVVNKFINKLTTSKNQIKLNILNLLDSSIITRGLEYALISGIFFSFNYSARLDCNSQILSKFSYISMANSILKVNSSIHKSLKQLYPRSIFSHYWGRICPIDTPEGESCGLIKNLSIFSSISNACYCIPSLTNLFLLDVKKFNYSFDLLDLANNKYYIFLGKNLLGYHINLLWFVYCFKQLRKQNFFDKFMNFNIISRFLIFNLDEGRITRPFFTIDFYKLKDEFVNFISFCEEINLNNFHYSGLIEFLDFEEELTINPVLYENQINKFTTHIEITDFSILGLCSGIVPFSNHNQSPRNTYHCSMEKQSITTFYIGYHSLSPYSTNLLWYSQRPLIINNISKSSFCDIFGGAQNIMLSVANYDLHEIEDSLVANKFSLFMGLFRSTTCFSYDFKKKEAKNAFDSTTLDFSENITTKQLKNKRNKLFLSNNRLFKTKNIYRINPSSTLQNITICNNANFVFTYSSSHFPEIGDKFCSRHGQKGVLGMINFNFDFPFDLNGGNPDFLMNPHGFPSRMTIGQIFESIISKASLINGCMVYLSNLYYPDVDIRSSIQTMMFKYIVKNGKETFFSGLKGKLMNTTLFSGPIFYQKLKHLVTEKYQSRGLGKRNSLTKQPVKGKKQTGGLRIGGMEIDCLVSFGCTSILIERLLKSSDSVLSILSNLCGGFENPITVNSSSFKLISKDLINFAFKILIQELQGANISIKVI
mmetsp:Transcript_16133/g.22526  ORF Transcript_16133/g.22526 Transcript_16133/m.22526 type:complete len:1061 (-) Transcript_16133:1595-4777(-)